MEFNAKITDRKLVFINKQYLQNFLGEMEDGQFLIVKIEKRKRLRTNNQNSMYWGYILPPIVETTGYTSEELHSAFKKMFLEKKFITVGDYEIEIDPTTTKLTTKEFTEFIEKIQAFSASELGIEWN